MTFYDNWRFTERIGRLTEQSDIFYKSPTYVIAKNQ